MHNTQKPEAQVLSRHGGMLDVHSIFMTIQGEGPFAGRPAVFVRLAGCNLQCPFCDTEYTEGRTWMDIDEIQDRISIARRGAEGIRLVVITGGEPFRQNIAELCRKLVLAGETVQIESNGVYAFDNDMRLLLRTDQVYLVVSPKTWKISAVAGEYATAFKYVLAAGYVSPDDGLPIKALGHKAAPTVARPPDGFSGAIYVNPMDSHDVEENRRNILAAVDSSLRFGYTLGVQIHKYIDMP